MKTSWAILIAIVSVCGCSGNEPSEQQPKPQQNRIAEEQEPATPTVEDPNADEPESSVTVEVISAGEPESDKALAAEHRSPKIVIVGAETPEQFEEAARNYFEKIADEIEAAVPDSKNKRIDLRAYDNDVDANSGNLCILHASNIASLRKPSWKKAYLDWRWRLPEFRPSREKLAIHAEYRKLRESVEDLADAQKQICEKHSLSPEEFIELHAYMMIWHSGGKPEGETLNLWKKDLLSKQQP